MSKHKSKKSLKFQNNPNDYQKVMLFLGAVAILSLSAHITDVASAINSQNDLSHGVMRAVEDHHHVHSGDVLIDRRNVAQYNSEEKSTSDRDRDNWEVYEDVLSVA